MVQKVASVVSVFYVWYSGVRRMSHKCGGPSCYRTQGRRSECPRGCSSRIQRLRKKFEALPRTPHGERYLDRHPDVKPEWVLMVIEDPHEQWVERRARDGKSYTLMSGRVQACHQWIKVVFEGETAGTLLFETAYLDRRLERKYGGRPWQA